MSTHTSSSTPSRTPSRTSHPAFRWALAAAAGIGLGAALGVVGGCASDDTVGHTKTTEKRVYDTPTSKTTVTETHEKDTKIVR